MGSGDNIPSYTYISDYKEDQAMTTDIRPSLVKDLAQRDGFLGKLPVGGINNVNGEPFLLVIPCSDMTKRNLLGIASDETGRTSNVGSDPHRRAKILKPDASFHSSIQADIQTEYPGFGNVLLLGEVMLSTNEKKEGGDGDEAKKDDSDEVKMGDDENDNVGVTVTTTSQSRQALHTDVGLDKSKKGVFLEGQGSLWAPANEKGAWIEFLVRNGEGDDFGRMRVFIPFGFMLLHNVWHAGCIQEGPSGCNQEGQFGHRYFCYLQHQGVTQDFTENMLHNVVASSKVDVKSMGGLGGRGQKATGTTRATIDRQVPQVYDLDRYIKMSTGWKFGHPENVTYKLGRVDSKGLLLPEGDHSKLPEGVHFELDMIYLNSLTG
jgi:hypothetical protein